ncbi:hypothetical protein EWM64_g8731 [Hericium alpestre]|uniref:FAD/NAD(P)-binding domain-containing protein n=1 Tax=Hericium alpestre TaxID=135208 RepID=A0A4Y9ZN62_9AGAM|nr:hypothetical protein EWM64_g8731 [Hericium alpestre]
MGIDSCSLFVEGKVFRGDGMSDAHKAKVGTKWLGNYAPDKKFWTALLSLVEDPRFDFDDPDESIPAANMTYDERERPMHLADFQERPRVLRMWERIRNKQAYWLIECISEAIGVFIVCFAGVGATAAYFFAQFLQIPIMGSLFTIGMSYAVGVAFAVMVCTSQNGGHFSPAITITFVLFKRYPVRMALRNIVFDTVVAAQPFGQEMPLSFVWEVVIGKWQYHGVEDLIPADKGLYEGTPVVNDEFLKHVRLGKCDYVRGDTLRFTTHGVQVRLRPRGTKPGQIKLREGDAEFPVCEVRADEIVLATGYKKPSVDFLPHGLFPEGYERPDLYLQNFSTEDWSVLLTNSAYVNAIGTVGHFHIGIYTRILLLFLLDESARPMPKDMKLWVDAVRFIKRGARCGALQFFTYMELTIWFVLFHVFRPDRIRWVFFVMQGWGVPVNKYNRVEGQCVAYLAAINATINVRATLGTQYSVKPKGGKLASSLNLP